MNNTIAVVDLENQSIIKTELTPDMADHLGGAAVNTLLMEKYSQNSPLVLGTGPLTGSFAPASCLMTASFRSDNGDRHVPVVMRSGALLKLSGIDFAVFLGRAINPCVVVIEKGRIRLLPADDLAGLSIPRAVKQLQSKGGEVALVTGPDTKESDCHHSASTSVYGGFDRCGLAGTMASKNIRAVVLKGGGRLPFAAEDLETDRLLTAQVQKQLPKKRSLTVLGKLTESQGARDLTKKYFRHSHACYHCPVGCVNFLQYPETDLNANNGQDHARGVFVLDHQGFADLSRKRPQDAHILMGKAMAAGEDPLALSEVHRHHNNGISAGVYHLFGGALPQILPPKTKEPFGTWEERVAFAMIVGVCPIPLLLLPALAPSAFLPFISRDQNALETLTIRLEKSINSLLATCTQH